MKKGVYFSYARFINCFYRLSTGLPTALMLAWCSVYEEYRIYRSKSNRLKKNTHPALYMSLNEAQTDTPLKISILIVFLILTTLSGCQQLSKQDLHLDGLPTPEAPYQRKDWPHWIDADKDCQNTRQELLIATSKIPIKFKNTKRCTVKTGLWIGPYTGRKFTQASDVDIDHIVPLAHAHRHGADKWTRAQRRTFANDFDNLLVVDDATNQAKSDKALHQWLPPNKAFWCEYGRRWQHVKDKYRLVYSKAERMSLKLMSETCFH